MKFYWQWKLKYAGSLDTNNLFRNRWSDTTGPADEIQEENNFEIFFRVCVCGRKLKQNAKVEMERRKKNASEISVGVMLRCCTPRLGSRRMLYHPSRFTPAKLPKNPLALLQFSRAVSPRVIFEDWRVRERLDKDLGYVVFVCLASIF